MTERKRATAIVAARYQKARKKEKGVILDEFTKLTGYGRRYASYVLRCHGKKVRINKSYVIKSRTCENISFPVYMCHLLPGVPETMTDWLKIFQVDNRC